MTPHLSLLEGEEVPLGGERGNQEAISSDITCGLAPRQPQGAVGQLTDLQVSGAHNLLFYWKWEKVQCRKKDEKRE